jgi:hypothetical protein
LYYFIFTGHVLGTLALGDLQPPASTASAVYAAACLLSMAKNGLAHPASRVIE